MIAKYGGAAFTMMLTAVIAPAHADTDDGTLEELRQQVASLQERVTALESLTTLTTFTPNFAERFHVMHHAGEVGDWAVASHEIAEVHRMATFAVEIDGEKGRLLER